jgi:hypothetical protein
MTTSTNGQVEPLTTAQFVARLRVAQAQFLQELAEALASDSRFREADLDRIGRKLAAAENLIAALTNGDTHE